MRGVMETLANERLGGLELLEQAESRRFDRTTGSTGLKSSLCRVERLGRQEVSVC